MKKIGAAAVLAVAENCRPKGQRNLIARALVSILRVVLTIPARRTLSYL
jgi:hypothetical protein